MAHSRRLMVAWPLAVGALILTACGSTVQTTASDGQVAADDNSALDQSGSLDAPTGGGLPGSGDGSGDGGAGAGLPGGSGDTGAGATGGDDGGSDGGGGDGSGGGSGGGGGGSGGGSGGLGGSQTGKIQVGVTYAENGDQANAAVGVAITRGNEKANAAAVIEDINDRGGINGRKLEPVYFAYDPTSARTLAQQDQAACSQFTEDNSIAVLLGGGGPNLDECMKKNGVLVIASGAIINPDNTFLSEHPNHIEAGTLTQNRMMADLVKTLTRLDYFSGWETLNGSPAPGKAKVGILGLDLPEWKRPVDSVLLPALSAAGYPVESDNIYYVSSPANTNEVPQTVAGIKSATLHFQSDNVTHVIILDGSALVTALFAQNAKQQAYYPRLGINSGSGVQQLYETNPNIINNDNLEGAVGLGWMPFIDLPAREAEKYLTSAAQYCFKVMKEKTGQTYTSPNAAGLALTKCDMGYLMEKALKKAGKDLSLATAVKAIESFGSSFVPALIPAAYFSPSRHDAAQNGYDMKWDTACSCTRYVGQHVIP